MIKKIKYHYREVVLIALGALAVAYLVATQNNHFLSKSILGFLSTLTLVFTYGFVCYGIGFWKKENRWIFSTLKQMGAGLMFVVPVVITFGIFFPEEASSFIGWESQRFIFLTLITPLFIYGGTYFVMGYENKSF